MNANYEYFFDILLLGLGIFMLVYMLYGRIKHKPLVGDYKPGQAGYDVFLKFVKNTRILMGILLSILLIAIKAIFDAQAVLYGPASDSILIVAPIVVGISVLVMIGVVPAVLGKKR